MLQSGLASLGLPGVPRRAPGATLPSDNTGCGRQRIQVGVRSAAAAAAASGAGRRLAVLQPDMNGSMLAVACRRPAASNGMAAA